MLFVLDHIVPLLMCVLFQCGYLLSPTTEICSQLHRKYVVGGVECVTYQLTSLDKSDSANHVEMYRYNFDNSGRLISESFGFLVKNIPTWKSMKVFSYNSKGQVLNCFDQCSGTEVFKSYYKRNRLVARRFYDENHKIKKYETYDYDSRGQLNKVCREYTKNQSLPYTETTFFEYTDSTIIRFDETGTTNDVKTVYDNEWKVLQCAIYGCFSSKKGIVEYNERGLPVRSSRCKILGPEHITISWLNENIYTYIYEYEYDEFGNWIKRTEYIESEENRIPIIETVRIIDYRD